MVSLVNSIKHLRKKYSKLKQKFLKDISIRNTPQLGFEASITNIVDFFNEISHASVVQFFLFLVHLTVTHIGYSIVRHTC